MFTDRRINARANRRPCQPWPSDRPCKILSLDGGGIKGLFTAQLLAKMEQELTGGKPLADYFDYIAGTSTGGIIALGLGLGMPARDILDFYIADGREIFPKLSNGVWSQAKKFVAARLDHEELEAALKKHFKEARIGDSTARLIIPSFMVPKTEVAVLKTDHHPDFRNDHKTLMWKAARATSAAPTYFKGLEASEAGKLFLDGGIWANNPSMVAIVDALSAYELTRGQIQLLSIGTGNPPFEISMTAANGGLIHWKDIIYAAMYLTTDNATAQSTLLLGADQVLRIEPKGDDAAIELDDYDGAHACLLPLAERVFDDRKEDIAPFFAETVAQRERYYFDR